MCGSGLTEAKRVVLSATVIQKPLFTRVHLLVSEGFDGVERGGFPGGVDAEEEADGAGYGKGDQDPGGGEGSV